MSGGERCPICSGQDRDIRGQYRATHVAFSGLRMAHCRSCGMVAAAPMPDEAALEQYNSSYFDTAHGGRAENPAAAAFFSAIAHLRIFHIERYLAAHRIAVASVLEWGPGPGYFARNWLRRHASNRYLAVETDTSCHPLLARAGVSVLGSPQLSGQQPVDLVVMNHVVEHVTQPVPFVRQATQLLQPGGALFIEVPCGDWQHKSTDEPHLLFFDKGPMQHMLKNLGFEDIDVSYHGATISSLRSSAAMRNKWLAVRSRLISLGVVAPFARSKDGLELLSDPVERAIVSPFKAHVESAEPAWWLRAIAVKSRQ